MIYPMALTLLKTVMIVSLGALLVLGTFLNIINISQDLSKPFTGLRGIVCRNFYWFMMNVIIWGSFMRLSTTYYDFDYFEFLGKD